MPVKMDLRHTEKAIKTLLKFDKILGAVAEDARGNILKLWEKGRGADGKNMPVLTFDYFQKKKASGRKGIRDLNWSGLLWKSLHVDDDTKLKKRIRFFAPFLDQARGNLRYAPNMMTVGENLQKRANKLATVMFWKAVNKG
jgi:hypothetical protein